MNTSNRNIFFQPISALAIASIFSLVLAMAGCGGGGGTTAVAPPTTTATTLTAVLRSSQEIPPTTSTATGTATVTVDAARTTIIVTLDTTGLTNVTASHIHFGKAGESGGVMFSLFAAPATFSSPLTKTLTSADFTATTGASTFADAVQAILAGNAYINVHTQANLGGEIRGQIGPASLAAVTMTGAQEFQIPAVVTANSGNATVKFDSTQSTITVTVNNAGLTNVTASHIHAGKVGKNGSPIFSLFAAPGTFTSPFVKTLTSADFTPDTANGIKTFEDAVNAIMSGNTYVNVHTQGFPNGEIRGQIGPAAFTAPMNGSNEIPVNSSPATGTATLRFNADQTAIAMNMVTQGFVTTVTASHIHFGPVGVNGGIMFSLFAAPATFTSPLTKTLTSSDFTATTGAATFNEALDAIMTGNAYINVHTNVNIGGEIRGQVVPQ